MSTPVAEEQSHVETLMMAMQPSTRNDQKNLKGRTLIRDGGHCVLTGISDSTYNPRGLPTECAHIIPFSIGSFNDNFPMGIPQISLPGQRLSILQVSNAAEIFTAIHFVFPELCNFDSENVNDDCNAFTLSCYYPTQELLLIVGLHFSAPFLVLFLSYYHFHSRFLM